MNPLGIAIQAFIPFYGLSKEDPNRKVVLRSVMTTWLLSVVLTLVFFYFLLDKDSSFAALPLLLDCVISSYLILNSLKSLSRQVILTWKSSGVRGFPTIESSRAMWTYRERTPYLLETQGHIPPTRRRKYRLVVTEYFFIAALSVGMYFLSGWFIFLALSFLFLTFASQQVFIWGAPPLCLLLGAMQPNTEALSVKLGTLFLVTQFVSMVNPIHGVSARQNSSSLAFSLRQTPDQDWTDAARWLIVNTPLVLIDCRNDSPAFLRELSLLFEVKEASAVLGVSEPPDRSSSPKTLASSMAADNGIELVGEEELFRMISDGRLSEKILHRRDAA